MNRKDFRLAVNLSQTICFSNGASAHERQLRVETGRSAIFNCLLRLRITPALFGRSNYIKISWVHFIVFTILKIL